MSRETAALPPPPPPPQPIVAPVYNVPTLPPSPPKQHAHAVAPQMPHPVYPAFNQAAPQAFEAPVLTASTSAGNPTPSSIAGLFASLVKAGLVSSTSTPVGGISTSQPAEPPKPPQVDPAVESARQYAKSVSAMKIKLTASDITKKRPQNIASLYEALPVQCKQCAIRFPEGPVGKKKMEDHLDMHFRQNRRAVQNVGRGHSRSWFVSIEDWINDNAPDLKGKGRDTSGVNASNSSAKEAAEREKALRASFVVVPPGDEAKSISCPVCKETLKSEFMEEDEEWVWLNAVRVKDKVFHATCHSEMVASSTLAAKLRNELTASRAQTPEVDSNRSTPPKGASAVPSALKTMMRASKSPTPERALAGTKRKAEGDVESTEDGTQRTPPMKKTAMAVATVSS